MITTVIIDDEQGPANTLRMLLPELPIPATCLGVAHTVLDGIKLIREKRPQVVFLDIDMPFHNGFDLLSHFESRDFVVVFVTAHEEYTLRAIKHNAFDYLLKPVDPDEMETCMEKVQKHFDNANELKEAGETLSKQQETTRQLAIPIRDGVVFLKQEDIVRVEGEGSYSVFYTSGNQKYVSSKHLKEFEHLLPESLFFRIHKSYLINITTVRKYLKTEGHYVEMEDGSVLEVARRRKDDLLAAINTLN
jgi:two-component system, LytTR family, response regulator